ncbi:MAG: glycogen debranching protein GlgX [bacterium]
MKRPLGRATLRLMTMETGRSAPLGATWDGEGVNFALASEHATRVDLCLFAEPRDADPAAPPRETARLTLPARTGNVWHGYLRGARAGLLYGYRVDGPFLPHEGRRFNAAKLVLDPYARAIARLPVWNDALFGFTPGAADEDLTRDLTDSAPFAAIAAVADTRFEWGDVALPRTPWHETILYELHVRGFTMRHPGVPAALRGTFAGLASDAAIEHLRDLGVTAVELLPVHQHFDEQRLALLGLTNFWGYNTLAFFAPDARLSAAKDPQGVVREFQSMVCALHAAGIEVILDVVYNHTAEGNHLGPTLSLRGVDNASAYRLKPEARRFYEDFSGCGNTIDVRCDATLDIIVDSLRYWAVEMRVDGFRFDLATALARDPHDFSAHAPFFERIRNDAVLSRVKLIAEPWDVGPNGYHVGGFPAPWREWNGKYRDCIRRFWRGDPGQIPELASRLTGSSDIFQPSGRPPHSSVNFVTCHDGFTLRDLVSYNAKHNEANGEQNRDGESHNNSWNCGAEGPTDDPAIATLRRRQARNLMATLVLSQGVPMLLAGDEMARTQRGNNNAYCQDNEISWVDWDHTTDAHAMLAFTRRILAIRAERRALRKPAFFAGGVTGGGDPKDITWLAPNGAEMDAAAWRSHDARCLGIRYTHSAAGGVETLLLLMNASDSAVEFQFPQPERDEAWVRLVDTSVEALDTAPHVDEESLPQAAAYSLAARSLALLLTMSARATPEPRP